MRVFALGLMFLAGCGSAASQEPVEAAASVVPVTTRPGDAHVWNTGCAAVDGHYVLDGAPAYTAGFRLAAPDFDSARTHLFWIHSDVTDRTFWYAFTLGTPPAVVPQAGPDETDHPSLPEGETTSVISLFPVGLDGVIGYEPPQGGGETAEAPPLILIPQLPWALDAHPFQERGSARENVPRAFFRLVRCGDQPVAWSLHQGLATAVPDTD